MDERQRDLDRRIRRTQRQLLLKAIWDARMLIAIAAVMLMGLAGSIAYNATPDRLEATVLGTAVGDNGVQTTRKGLQYHHETIRLANGATVVLDLPGNEPVRHDVPMKVEIHQKDFGPLHQVSYRFAGYADDQTPT